MNPLEPIAENENLLSDVKYDIQDEFKVAEFDPKNVEKHHLKLFMSACSKSSITDELFILFLSDIYECVSKLKNLVS